MPPKSMFGKLAGADEQVKTPMQMPQGGGYAAPSYLENQSSGKPSFTPPQEVPGDQRGSEAPAAGGKPVQVESGGQPMPVYQPQNGPIFTPPSPPAMPQMPQQGVPAAGKLVGEAGGETPTKEAPAPQQPEALPTVAPETNGFHPLTETVDNMLPKPDANAQSKQFGDLAKMIQAAYQNSSRYDSEQAKKTFDFMKGDLEQERDKSLSEDDADAASRGVFYGTPGTNMRIDTKSKYNRGLGQLASDISLDQARTAQSDKSQAFGDAFKFLGMGQDQDKINLMLAQLAGNLGNQGNVDFGDVMHGLDSQPTPDFGGGIDWSGLGALFGNSSKQPAAGKNDPSKKKPGASSGDNSQGMW